MSQFALLGGSAALSGAGSILGGQSANRAARQARDWYDKRTDNAAASLNNLFWGNDRYNDLRLASEMYGNLTSPEEQAAAAGRFNASTGGSLYDLYAGIAPAAASAQTAAMGRFDASTAGLADLYGGLAGNLNARMKAGSDATLASYDRGAAGVTTNAQKGLAELSGFGRDREAIIRRDAGKLRDELDAQTRSQLAAAGFGGTTIAANQTASNARQAAEVEQNQLADLGEFTTLQKVDQRNRLSDLGERLFTNRAGLQAGLFQSAIGQAERLGTQGAQTAAGLASQRAGYDFAAIDRQAQLSQLPLAAALGVQTSAVANPWLGQNTSAFYPGVSGVGTAASSIGNLGASIAGMSLMDLWSNRRSN